MDWRHPNPTPLFSIEKSPQDDRPRNLRRFARSIHNPSLYGLCTRDFQRDHQPWMWPSGTEYQYAYCSNYRDLLPPINENYFIIHEDPKTMQQEHQQHNYKLYETTPLPLLDKHYKGATYLPDDPLGVQVPEELTRCREKMDGSFDLISFDEHLKNPYTPNYRYKDWITRPLTETTREMDANYTLYCHLPQAPTQYWDFYNEVCMGRPAKPGNADPVYQPCRVIPIPANKDIPNLPGTGEVTHYGKLANYRFTETPFVTNSARA